MKFEEEEFELNDDGTSGDPEKGQDGDDSYSSEEDQGQQVSDDSYGNREENNEEPEEKKYDIRQVIKNIQHEKHQILAENDRLKQELGRYRDELVNTKNDLVSTTNLSFRNYEQNVINSVKNAQQKLTDAEESGDIESKKDALTELNRALNEQFEIDKIKASYKEEEAPERTNNYNQNDRRNYQNNGGEVNGNSVNYPGYDPQRELQYWAIQNPWFDKKSKYYDPELTEFMSWYADTADNILRSQGNSDVILSPRYFQDMTEVSSELQRDRNKLKYELNKLRSSQNNYGGNDQQDRGLNMKQSRSSVSPVRGRSFGMQNSSPNSRPHDKMRIPKEAEALVENLGVKKDVYLKALYEFQKKEKERGQSY